ncbi:MAG: hypothetical protein WAP37_04110, partial [Solirubrobacterales bacterium]
VAGMVVIGAIFVALLPTTAPPGATASVRLTDVTGGENRTVLATVRYSPAEITRRPDWLQAFAWQGNDKAMSFPMRRIGDGIWRTPRPLPVHGTWKVGIRLHDGRTMATVPVYFPADEALGLPVLPAPARFERALVRDMELMQRERIDGVPDWAFSLGSSIVAALTVMMMLFLGWSMLRVARGGSAGTPTPGEREAMQPIVS